MRSTRRSVRKDVFRIAFKYVFMLGLIGLIGSSLFLRASAEESNAITINSVEVLEKSVGARELSSASFDRNQLKLNLMMRHVGDSIKYGLSVTNNNDRDFIIDTSSLKTSSEYVSYTITVEDGVEAIKAGESKALSVIVKYENSVPDGLFLDGSFVDDQTIPILATSSDEANPETSAENVAQFVIILFGAVLFLFIIAGNHKSTRVFGVIAIFLFATSINAYAASATLIQITSSVTIGNTAEFDLGSTVNEKMGKLAGGKQNIVSFSRSNNLPENIKTVAEQQQAEADEITVSDEEVEESFEEILATGWMWNDFHSKKEDGKTYYCYSYDDGADEDCYGSGELQVELYYSDAIIVHEAGSSENKFLVYDDIDEVKLLSELEFKSQLKGHLTDLARAELTTNILSSEASNYMIYGWYDSGAQTIYWYSEKDEVFLNKESSMFFSDLTSLERIPEYENNNMSHVRHMDSMFYNAGRNSEAFDLDLSGWDVSSVVTMQQLFDSAGYGSSSLNLDLTGWDVSNVKKMGWMFYTTGHDAIDWNVTGLSAWDTSSATDMRQMFTEAAYNDDEFNLNLSNWDVSNVESIRAMFYRSGYNASTYNLDLANWKAPKLRTAELMFHSAGYNSNTFNLNAPNWDISNAETTAGMFGYTGYEAPTFALNVPDWKATNVKNMETMFLHTGSRANIFSLNLSGWEVKGVTNMRSLFSSSGYYSTTWSIGDLSGWDVSHAEDMSWVFSSTGAYNATSWYAGDLSSWDTSSATDMSHMFSRAGGEAETWGIGDLSNWNTSKVTSMEGMFNEAGGNTSTWHIGDLSNWDVSNVKIMDHLFYHAGSKSTIWDIGDLSNWDVSNVTNMYCMFSGGGGASTWHIGDLSNWDVSKVTNMANMFERAGKNASTWNIGDLSNWDTSKVTNMSSMFKEAGQNASTWHSIGSLKIYASNISNIFSYSHNAKATLLIYSQPTSYTRAFYEAATAADAGITVNYKNTVTNIISILSTKSNGSKVYRGSVIDD